MLRLPVSWTAILASALFMFVAPSSAPSAPGPPAARGEEAPAEVSPPDRPGGLLRAGITLVYTAQGEPGERWRIEEVLHGQDHAGRTDATRIRYAPSEPGDAPEVRWRSVEDRYLMAFDEDSGRWSISRPVGPRMSWEKTDGSGRVTSRYETGEAGTDRIGDMEVAVVETIISFPDDDGHMARRLRERYALGLETATRGTFEVPDPDNPGRWKPTLTFELVEIQP